MADAITFQEDKFLPEHKDQLNILVSFYGAKVVADMLGMGHWSSIQQWRKGKSNPTEWHIRLLRSAYEVHQMIITKKTAKGAREWMTTIQPDLYGGSPATVLSVDPDLVRIMALQVVAGGR